MSTPSPKDLKARARELREQRPDLSPATRRTYDSAWSRFERWCKRNGYTALPATPDAVAGHLSEYALRLSLPSLRNTLAAVAHQHAEADAPDPTQADPVRYIWKAILEMHREREDESGSVEVDVEGLLTDELRRMIEALPDSISGRRDRAALLIGAAAGLERAKLAALRFEEVEHTDEGARLRIGSTGANPRVVRVRQARDKRFDVGRAIEAWLEDSGITDGPLLRGVDRHDNVGEGPLSVRAVSALVRRAAEEAQIEGEGYGYGQLVTGTRMRE